MPFDSLKTEPGSLMRPRPKSQPRIDFDPDPSLGRRIVAPLWANKNALANLHRFQVFSRERHPVAEIGRRGHSPEPRQQIRLPGIVIEKYPKPVAIEFDDTGAARLPQVGDENVFIVNILIVLLTVEVD